MVMYFFCLRNHPQFGKVNEEEFDLEDSRDSKEEECICEGERYR